ncbi:MAG: hypothetical protein K9H49_08210 [Bacteroidales bacterium]|nr:hypothetical protein [Bacteroidales bacterium]MCF8404691.1 hypothetical protein [Bacteroidales bacterium]
MKKPVYTFVLFAVVFVYLVLRAIYVPLLHDEIATFFRFVHVGKFIPYYCEWSTNNHFLNSLLTYLSYKLLGDSAFAQRLPNLLFIPVFFCFVYKISLEIKSVLLRFIFILLLLSFHNFIDFFSLSRGYGISLALLAGGIYYTMKALRDNYSLDYFKAIILSLLSVSAILIMVNSFIIIIGILLINALVKNQGTIRIWWKQVTILVMLGIGPVIFVVIYLMDMNNVGRLDYGGMEGFWQVSVMNLTDLLVGTYSAYLNVLVAGLFGLILLLFIFFTFRNKKIELTSLILKPRWIFFYLLTGNIIGFVLENKLFGILYPEERTSIQFILFFLGALIFFLDEIPEQFKKYRYIPIIPFILLPVHFILSLNLSFSKVDTHNFNIPDSFYETVKSYQKPGDFPPTVQAYQLRIMRWNYHNFTKKGEQSVIHFSGYPSLDGDFQIVQVDEFPAWTDYYEILDTEKLSGAVLMKRKHFLKKIPLAKMDTISTPVVSDEFIGLGKGSVDTLGGTSLYFGFRMCIVSDARPFHAWIVVEVLDDQNNIVRYEYLPFDWYRTRWTQGDEPFVNGLLVQGIPQNSSIYRAYIWNIYNATFRINESNLEIFKLERDY